MIAILLHLLALHFATTPTVATVTELVTQARAARVPPSLLVAVCTVESHVGRYGTMLCGCYGRADDNLTIAGQARCAAGTLAHGYRACGSWEASLRRYRYGLADHGCPIADPRRYVARVTAVRALLTPRVAHHEPDGAE